VLHLIAGGSASPDFVHKVGQFAHAYLQCCLHHLLAQEFPKLGSDSLLNILFVLCTLQHQLRHCVSGNTQLSVALFLL